MGPDFLSKRKSQKISVSAEDTGVEPVIRYRN